MNRRLLPVTLAALLAAFSAPAIAEQNKSHEATAGVVGEAMTLAMFCNGDNPLEANLDEISVYVRSTGWKYDDEYRELLSAAKKKAVDHYIIEKQMSVKDVCKLALKLYGPKGSKAKNLVKPRN